MRIVATSVVILNALFLYTLYYLGQFSETAFVNVGGDVSVGFIIIALGHFRTMSSNLVGVLAANSLMIIIFIAHQSRRPTAASTN